MDKDRAPAPRPADAGPDGLEPVAARAPTSIRAAVVVVAAFVVIAVALAGGGGGSSDRGVGAPPSPRTDGAANGILVYAVDDGSGAARLWLWHLPAGPVTKGPLIREPLELLNVRSPGYGWIAFTSDLGNGIHEVAVLDALRPDAEADPIGRADLVGWARDGGTAILVDRGPALGGCRRRVVIDAVHLDIGGGERVFDDRICGDVLSVGRTSLGYVFTRTRPGGADIVATGYDQAGILLPDHGLIAISPGGEMLVTPASQFIPAAQPVVAGTASFFTQFGGRPVPYEVRGEPLLIDRVLAYSPASMRALVIGRLPGDPPGLWEVPLGIARTNPRAPRFVVADADVSAAAYAGDGTAFVVARGRLWSLRDHRMEPVDVPEGAPTPTGPLVWIVREPLTEL